MEWSHEPSLVRQGCTQLIRGGKSGFEPQVQTLCPGDYWLKRHVDDA